MTESQWLKTKPVAEIIFTCIDTKNKVLVTDAEFAFPVYSRLVTGDHSRKNGLTVEVLANILRPFVDIKIETDTVAGSVAEIALGVP